MAKSSNVLHTDTSSAGLSYSTIGSQPQCFLHNERAVTKSNPIFGKNPLDVFEPIWDGTAFSIDPYVARAIRDRLAKGLDM